MQRAGGLRPAARSGCTQPLIPGASVSSTESLAVVADDNRQQQWQPCRIGGERLSTRDDPMRMPRCHTLSTPTRPPPDERTREKMGLSERVLLQRRMNSVTKRRERRVDP